MDKNKKQQIPTPDTGVSNPSMEGRDSVRTAIGIKLTSHDCSICEKKNTCTFSAAAEYFKEHPGENEEFNALAKTFFGDVYNTNLMAQAMTVGGEEHCVSLLVMLSLATGYAMARGKVQKSVELDIDAHVSAMMNTSSPEQLIDFLSII